MDAENGRNPVSKQWRMSRLTREGTAEPVSRDQILRRERGQGKGIFPIQLEPRAELVTIPGWSILCYE